MYLCRKEKVFVDHLLLNFPLLSPQSHQGSAMNVTLLNPWRTVFSLWRRYGVPRRQTAAVTWQFRCTFACFRRTWQASREGALRKTSAYSADVRAILQRSWERKDSLTTGVRWVAAPAISAPRGTSPLRAGPGVHPAVRWKEHEAGVTSFIPWVFL